MYKPHCKIACLPETLRLEINYKLRDGAQYDTIREWLFEQRADRDIPELGLKTGESYAEAWLREAKSAASARASCRAAIGRWFHSYYCRWLDEQTARAESLKIVDQSEELGAVAKDRERPDSIQGVNLVIRSLLFEALQRARNSKTKTNPVTLARLAHAWARISQSRAETEKLKLHTQSAIDIGLQALYDEMKDNPEAVAQFQKLREIMKRPAKRTS